MVPVSVTAACVVTLFVSMILPLIMLFVFMGKHRKQGILSAWLIGAAGFLVTQICIRVPILTALGSQSWFIEFSQENLFLYAFILAFTAGLFELAGRYGSAKLMGRKLNRQRALAAGLGHGGIEAMVIVGMTYVNNLVYISMINSGTLDAMLTQVPADQAAYLESIRASLTSMGAGMFLLAGFERLLTMIVHTAMSFLVCRGVHSGKIGKCLLVCLGLHTFIDLTAGISLLIGTVLTRTTAYLIIYAILVVVAALSLWIIRDICRRWKEEIHEEV